MATAMEDNQAHAQLIWQVLEAAAEPLPEIVGYVYQDTEISFKQMDEMSDRFAAALLQLGFQKGDRLGIIALTSPQWLIAYFAGTKIGVIIVGLSVRYRDTELEYMINQSAARGIVSTTAEAEMNYVAFFDDFRKKIPSVEHFVFIDGSGFYERGFEGSHAFDALLQTQIDHDALKRAKALVVPDDLVMIIYTSGTTGKPKGATLTHKSQLASARAQAEHTGISAADTGVLGLPLNHVGGITCSIIASLVSCSKVVLIPAFSPGEVIRQSRTHHATTMGGVPTMHTLMLMDEEFSSLDATAIRSIFSGGSNAEPALLRKIRTAYPNAEFMNLYGLSESSGGMVMSPRGCEFDMLVRSIGKPIGDFQAKVIDEEGIDLSTGKTGELCVRGDAVGPGYFRMPVETAEAFDRDGWLHTGDVARIDEDGYIILMGRIKEMYLQGGFNVYPVEIENLLTKYPGVQMAAGIGVPDSILGEVGRYYIVPEPGVTLDSTEILDYCSKHLADYKRPRQIVFREELPLTPVGKIMKSLLKEQYEQTGH